MTKNKMKEIGRHDSCALSVNPLIVCIQIVVKDCTLGLSKKEIPTEHINIYMKFKYFCKDF